MDEQRKEPTRSERADHVEDYGTVRVESYYMEWLTPEGRDVLRSSGKSGWIANYLEWKRYRRED